MTEPRTETDALLLLALMQLPGVGCATLNRLIGAAAATGMTLARLRQTPPRQRLHSLPPGAAPLAAILDDCTDAHRRRAERLLAMAQDAGAVPIAATGPDYPAPLGIALESQAPPLLFLRGDVRLLHQPMAAIVGARQATSAGLRLAEGCAALFTSRGIPIVSGGAVGIDTAAHQAALASGGRTLVILPMGIAAYEPPPEIAAGLDTGHAAILSQFAPDAAWLTHAAVTRNALIAAFASLVCVIEPRKTGGSIRTALLALRQGKRVFCQPAAGTASIRAWMKSAGVMSLKDGAGNPDAFNLLEAWRAEPCRRKQMELL